MLLVILTANIILFIYIKIYIVVCFHLSFFRNDINNKKIVIILTFLGVSVLGAIILSFVNVHYDFLELRNFYRGYMGRRLLIQEGRLTYRKLPGTSETKVTSPAATSQQHKLSYFIKVYLYLWPSLS